jgi:integrase/recombinase XerD
MAGRRARKTKPRVTRFLEDDLWQAINTSIDTMPRDTVREQEHYARGRWLISLLYLMGLLISEVVSNPIGGFFRRRGRDGQDQWWLAITGKSDKERLLLATTELIAELARDRRHTVSQTFSYSGETTPLLFPTLRPPPASDGRGLVARVTSLRTQAHSSTPAGGSHDPV